MPPVTKYRFDGRHLAQANGAFSVQHGNHGMLELAIDGLVPGGKENLILSLADFTIPRRTVGTAELPYINGNLRYPTRPAALEHVTATFRDFPRAGSRAILQKWFDFVYNEITGLMLPESALKVDGFVVLFDSQGGNERAARLEGVFPTGAPGGQINWAQGEIMTMSIDLSVDAIIWDNSLYNPTQG